MSLFRSILKEQGANEKELSNCRGICEQFSITTDFMKEFTDFAEQEGVKKDEEQFAKSEKYISNLLKARLASNLWDFAAFWQVYNESDDVYNKALQIIQDKAKFKELRIND